MLENTRRLVAGIGALALAASVLAFAPSVDSDRAEVPDEVTQDGAWHIEATGARIIGGYGDNFAYDGSNVRPIEGRAVVRLDPDEGTGKVRVKLQTTDRSGPVHFAEDTKWEGEIEIVQQLDTGEDTGRIMQDVFLHGDTGREAPVMPRIYNYFATWGPSKIMVNGDEAVPMIGSHTMFTEQARGADGKIARGNTVYHPMKVDDKTGFTDPDELEFHYVAHTDEQDQDNFPPHTAWIHLHFDDVEIKSKPSGVQVPYDRRQAQAGR